MLKHSHFRTPRSMDQCQFTVGYGRETDTDWTELGHKVLEAFGIVGLIVVVTLVVAGVL